MLQATLLPVRRKPLYVVLAMVRMGTAWRLTFQSWRVRVSVT